MSDHPTSEEIRRERRPRTSLETHLRLFLVFIDEPQFNLLNVLKMFTQGTRGKELIRLSYVLFEHSPSRVNRTRKTGI